MCFFSLLPLNFSPHWKLIHLFALSVCAVSKLFSSRGGIFPNNGITVFSRNLTGRTQNNNLGSSLDSKTILKIEIFRNYITDSKESWYIYLWSDRDHIMINFTACRVCVVHAGLSLQLVILKDSGKSRKGIWSPSVNKVINEGNGTEWSPVWSVIIQVINKIGQWQSGSLIC